MNKKVFSNCILGYGYASIIASINFEKKGIDHIILRPKRELSFDVIMGDERISPIPIYPVKESALYQELNQKLNFQSDSIKVIHKNKELSHFKYSKYEKDSLAAFILANKKNSKFLPLSLKQWGEQIFHLPFNEVKRKIERHYSNGNQNTRVGYSNGLSFYNYIIKYSTTNILDYKGQIKIDPINKIVKVDSEEIKFNNLISTIPLKELFKSIEFDSQNDKLDYQKAHFYYYTLSNKTEANNLIYDLAIKSPILRVFTVTENCLMVQLSNYQKTKISNKAVKNSLRVLFPKVEQFKFQKELHFPMSYPIERNLSPKSILKIKELKSKNITPFGRFGNWEYRDLHELNWNEII